ncbi:MAG: ATP-binding protein [Chthoniobacteraceae bacterium]|nr:ATP-binding protein [Chthoniobacteraceae bacterium]
MSAPMPEREAERLAALRDYGLMDTPPEAVFDEIAALASYVFHAPIAGIGLLDERRQWFKARIGIDFTEAPREAVFCAHTILEPDILVVLDALDDPRFVSCPYVVGPPGVRFYAGVPLITREGHALGALCVVDTEPRESFEPEQKDALKTLGRHLMAHMELRCSSAFLARALRERRQSEQAQHALLLERERELGRLNEMKDHFLALLAHELRNPLASIVNALELLRSPAPEDAAAIIETQVTHLSRLIEDLLDLSRVTRGKIALRKTALDLVEAVRAAARAARSAFFKGGQQFILELPETPVWVQADPVRFEQIVSNLLANAAKFTGPGKQVRLCLEAAEAHALLRVRDEGIGISPAMLERIFEPFVQADAGRDRTGLGLGLPLVRQLASLHGGSVEVRSEGPGRGAEFIVRLPLQASPPAPSSEPAEEAALVSPRLPVCRRVLVVEDNAALGSTLSRLLSRWGHEPRLVNSGAVVLEEALAFRPEVALVDIGLPERDGFSVAKCLCSTPELAGVRLFAMSGYGGEEEHAREAGFHEFLLKPVDPLALRHLLEG